LERFALERANALWDGLTPFGYWLLVKIEVVKNKSSQSEAFQSEAFQSEAF
jgi:hypothetical protein